MSNMHWLRAWLYGKEVDDLNNVDEPQPMREVSVTTEGAIWVSLAQGTSQAQVDNPNSDGKAANDPLGLVTLGTEYLYNGSTFDRKRANTEETILASAARTATTNSADFTNYNARGAHFIVDVSAIAATPSITVTIQGKDPISSNYYDILVSSALTATGTTILKVYPGIGQVANGAASDILPRTFRVSVAHADTDSITYSVGAALVL